MFCIDILLFIDNYFLRNLCKNNFKSLDTKFMENLTNLEKL